jgi:hypothetical protein
MITQQTYSETPALPEPEFFQEITLQCFQITPQKVLLIPLPPPQLSTL